MKTNMKFILNGRQKPKKEKGKEKGKRTKEKQSLGECKHSGLESKSRS